MQIMLFGCNGQLGWELQRTLGPLGSLYACDINQLDLSDAATLRLAIQNVQPDLIVNASAYTAVDKAEDEPEIALAVNGHAPGIMAEEMKKTGGSLIHFSTDYVFDGEGNHPYSEDAPPRPINVYGQSKLYGENAVRYVNDSFLIFRTSWVYSLRRESFVTKALRWARTQPMMKVVTDQIGSPTWCRMLAEITAQVLAQGSSNIFGWIKERSGIYHLAGDGSASRFDVARTALEFDPKREEHLCDGIQPALTIDFPTPARRPLFTALDCSRFKSTFHLSLPDWRECLRLAMDEVS